MGIEPFVQKDIIASKALPTRNLALMEPILRYDRRRMTAIVLFVLKDITAQTVTGLNVQNQDTIAPVAVLITFATVKFAQQVILARMESNSPANLELQGLLTLKTGAFHAVPDTLAQKLQV